jgi:hypothetical protein
MYCRCVTGEFVAAARGEWDVWAGWPAWPWAGEATGLGEALAVAVAWALGVAGAEARWVAGDETAGE